jgi:hypothetical protein
LFFLFAAGAIMNSTNEELVIELKRISQNAPGRILRQGSLSEGLLAPPEDGIEWIGQGP